MKKLDLLFVHGNKSMNVVLAKEILRYLSW